MKKRSNEKRITKEAQILRHMRKSRSLSLNQAGKKLGITGSAIAHMEQGRMDLSKKRIHTMIESYGYTLADYLEYYDGKAVPRNLRDECIILLRICDESKISMIHPLLSNLVSH